MGRTRRQKLVDRLTRGPATVRGLASEMELPIRQIVEDLEHVRRSLGRARLRIEPARCRGCGHVFSKRERLTAPSRCPRCRSEQTTEPELRLD